MHTAHYRIAIRWIALNARPDEHHIVVGLVSDLFGVELDAVLADIVKEADAEARRVTMPDYVYAPTRHHY